MRFGRPEASESPPQETSDSPASRHAVKSAITADDVLAPCEDLEEAALEDWKGGEGTREGDDG